MSKSKNRLTQFEYQMVLEGLVERLNAKMKWDGFPLGQIIVRHDGICQLDMGSRNSETQGYGEQFTIEELCEKLVLDENSE